jgi:hypothetical protein
MHWADTVLGQDCIFIQIEDESIVLTGVSFDHCINFWGW